MKCMKDSNVKGAPVIVRVSEERAIELARKGWKFIPKLEWKQALDTTWKKASTPPNPMSEKKRFRQEKRRNH